MGSQNTDGGDATGTEPGVDEGRRTALAKMGGLAAPAFIALLTTNASEAWSASGRPGKPKPPKPPRPPRPRLPRIFDLF